MKNNGLLVVNKPSGMTSRDVVNILNKKLKTKSIGHTGTLDPLADGVLVCLIGKYTKLANILVNHDKEYIAKFKLGTLTDTLDIIGKVIDTKEKNVSKEKLIEALKHFTCTYNQEVPIYSAVKVNGKKLYEYARQNKEVDLPKKEVTIYSLELLDLSDEITIRCKVSKGTYIRSLINDIGIYLNTYACMTNLTRTKLGDFTLDNSYTLEEIENNNYKLLDLKDFLDIEEIKLNDEDYKYVKNGNIMNYQTDKYVLYTYKNENIALYQKHNQETIKPLIMF